MCWKASWWKFDLLLVNPQQVRALRGRKTDRIDVRRIAEYLQYGLLHGNFVSPRFPRRCAVAFVFT